MTIEPNKAQKKPVLVAVAFVEPVRIDGKVYPVVLTENRDYAHLALSESPGFVLVVSDRSPDRLVRVPLANVKWLESKAV